MIFIMSFLDKVNPIVPHACSSKGLGWEDIDAKLFRSLLGTVILATYFSHSASVPVMTVSRKIESEDLLIFRKNILPCDQILDVVKTPVKRFVNSHQIRLFSLSAVVVSLSEHTFQCSSNLLMDTIFVHLDAGHCTGLNKQACLCFSKSFSATSSLQPG